MATTVTGTFTNCGPGQFFSLEYQCTGPNCFNINDFPNTTCTTSGTESILSCSNQVICSGPTNYTSKFNFTQSDTIVSQSYNITYGCEKVILTQDGTTGGTNIAVADIPGCVSNATSNSTSSASFTSTLTPLYSNSTSPAVNSPTSSGSLPTSPGSSESTPVGGSTTVTPLSSASPTTSKPLVVTSGAAPHHQTKFGTIYLLLFFFAVFIQGTVALAEPPSSILPETKALKIMEDPQNDKTDLTILELRATGKTPVLAPYLKNFEGLLTEYLNGKVQAAKKGEELFASNLIAEIENAVCSHLVGVAINKLTKYDAIDACVATIIEGSLLDPPAEFVAVFEAGMFCNWLFSELFPQIDAFTNAFCALVPKPCSLNFLTDPKNCGRCGNKCATGVCANGACTSNACTGEICSTFGPCGPGGSCVCASTAEGTGYCADGNTPCAGLADCKDSTNCASGEICAVGSCCTRNVCVGATFCGGSGAAAVTPRYLLQRSWQNATIADLGVWVD